jgi:hypothetical protein
VKRFYLFVISILIPAAAFAADASPSPQPSSNVTTANLSKPQSTNDLTYANKMKYRKEREDYNKLVQDYNDMILKRAAGGTPAVAPSPTPAPGQATKAFNEQRIAEKKKAKLKKRVLVS